MLKGKVALVTGASRGIGRAIAEKLAQNGANVVINYKANKDAALDVQKSVTSCGVESMLYQANVESFDEVGAMVDSVIEKFGRIDILVNNAGIARNGMFKDMSLETWNEVINVNLTGAFNLCKLVSKHMIQQKHGKIINMSSIGGIVAIDGVCNYSSSKAGVMAFTRVLGRELIPYNINVNCIAPGLVNTDLLMNDVDDNMLEALKAQVPAKRIGEPEEIAELALYLCRDVSSYTVGQTFVIDGGLSLG